MDPLRNAIYNQLLFHRCQTCCFLFHLLGSSPPSARVAHWNDTLVLSGDAIDTAIRRSATVFLV